MSDFWEMVNDEAGRRVRRCDVPGGWLYQCEAEGTTDHRTAEPVTHHRMWSNPVFVAKRWPGDE